MRPFLILSLVAACGASTLQPDDPGLDGGVPSIDAPFGSDAPTVTACSGKATQPRDATWTVAGRTVRVHVPASYDPGVATPVVINLHGWSYDGQDQARVSRILAVSDSAGFIAVHPDGHDSPRGWNAGVCCGAAATSGTNDTAWIASVIDELETRLCVDPDRVFAMGLSNGGFMAHRLACELSDRIAAIGAVAGVVGIATCTPSRPVPVFHVHGTSDLVVPYGGGGVNGNEPVATTIDRWKTTNGCTGSPTTSFQQGDASCSTYATCTNNANVTLCTIQSGGHQWPGGESIGAINGKKSDNLDATSAMWTFFAAHPRP